MFFCMVYGVWLIEVDVRHLREVFGLVGQVDADRCSHSSLVATGPLGVEGFWWLFGAVYDGVLVFASFCLDTPLPP